MATSKIDALTESIGVLAKKVEAICMNHTANAAAHATSSPTSPVMGANTHLPQTDQVSPEHLEPAAAQPPLPASDQSRPVNAQPDDHLQTLTTGPGSEDLTEQSTQDSRKKKNKRLTMAPGKYSNLTKPGLSRCWYNSTLSPGWLLTFLNSTGSNKHQSLWDILLGCKEGR